MTARRPLAPIRHPRLGFLMPWADARIVPAGTLLQYLGEIRYEAIQRLADEGCFAHKGCTVGDHLYVPAAIWRANHWTPDVAFLAVTSATDGVFAEVERQISRAADRGRPPTAHPATLRVVDG